MAQVLHWFANNGAGPEVPGPGSSVLHLHPLGCAISGFIYKGRYDLRLCFRPEQCSSLSHISRRFSCTTRRPTLPVELLDGDAGIKDTCQQTFLTLHHLGIPPTSSAWEPCWRDGNPTVQINLWLQMVYSYNIRTPNSLYQCCCNSLSTLCNTHAHTYIYEDTFGLLFTLF